MSLLRNREPSAAGATEPAGHGDLLDPIERLFEMWTGMLPFRRGRFTHDRVPGDMIRVDEYRENGALVVRAELPGIDPRKDAEVTVSDGVLNIRAERREESADEKAGDKGHVRRELRYGSLCRSLPMPRGVSETDVKATYKSGILEIRIPAPEPAAGKKVEVTTSYRT